MKRVLWWVAGVLALFAGMGCGASLGPAVPEGGGWLEARSEHFVVRGRFAAHEADAKVSELERLFAAFTQVAYPHHPKPEFTTEIVLLDDRKQLEALGYAEPGALIHRSGADLEERLTLISHAELVGAGQIELREQFLHELAHRFTAFYFPTAPSWLSEGLSELFSTLELDDRRVLIGKYARRVEFSTKPWALTRGVTGWFVNVPIDRAPSVLELRGFSAARFYGDEASPDPKSDVARMERAKNYAGAWNLVHALLLGDRELRTRFNRYLRALARGRQSPEEAWRSELSAVAPRIERAYTKLLPETTRTVAAVPFSPPPAARPFLRPLSDADIRLVLASVRRPSDPRQAALAAGDLGRALELEPKHADARFVSAFQRLLAGDFERVRVELAGARSLAPDDPRGLQLELMLAIVQKDDALADRHARALSGRATTATQHALLAAYYAATGNARAAIRFARRGIAIDPTCWRCFSALADADVALGNLPGALIAQATAVNLLAEDDPRRPRHRRRLAELEQKLFVLR